MTTHLFPLIFINPFSAGSDIRGQNLKYKVDPHTERVKYFLWS